MVTLQAQFPLLPLGLYVRRIAVLAEGGALLTRGNADFMRLSEVRLPTSGNDAEQCA